MSEALKSPPPKPADGRGAARRSPRILRWTVGLPIAGLLLPTLSVLALAMLPTLGAYAAERSQERHLVMTVGLMNLCGSLPAVVKLWSLGQSFGSVGSVIHDVYAWLIAYGAAGCGWLIYLITPPVVAAYYRVASEARVQILKYSQRDLVELWGPEVAEGPDKTGE
jgi:hypothetical protein